MHPTAMQNGKDFFGTYSRFFDGQKVTVVEIGSQNVNGTLREVCPKTFDYIGVDFQNAKGVDIILKDPYDLPFEDASVDIVVSSSCFEHSEMFWLSYLEILRILKPNGLFYMNVPSDGGVHKYPVDCWRFYPDSGNALIAWSKRNNYNPILLECYTQVGGGWQDYVAIFLKDRRYKSIFTDRILNRKEDFENGMRSDQDVILNAEAATQNERKIGSMTLKGVLRKFVLFNYFRSLLRQNPRQL